MLIQLHVILEALVGKLNLIFRPPHLYRGQTNKYAQYGCFQPILITNNYTKMLQYQWSATNYSLQNDCKVEQTTKTAPIKTSWRVDLLRGCKHRTAELKRCLPDTMANECIFTFNQKMCFFHCFCCWMFELHCVEWCAGFHIRLLKDNWKHHKQFWDQSWCNTHVLKKLDISSAKTLRMDFTVK